MALQHGVDKKPIVIEFFLSFIKIPLGICFGGKP